jgi:hypothetical protein
MMKKFFFMVLMAVTALNVEAQDVQLHYDLGRNLYPDEEAGRQKVTMTLEHFKIDEWGSWFYFVDVDFSRKFTESAYTEVSREFNFYSGSPYAFHVEYDGGLSKNGSFQQAVLAGVAWNGYIPSSSTTYSLQLLYKRYFKSYNYTSAYHSMQLTGVWNMPFAGGKCAFSGFIDFWRGEKANGHGQLVFLTEPQLWYNATKHLSIGTEWEVSDNFVFNQYNDKTFFVNPTIAVKWNF